MLTTSYMRDKWVRSTPYTRVQDRSADISRVRRAAWVDLGREYRVLCINVDIQESVHRESYELEYRYIYSLDLCFSGFQTIEVYPSVRVVTFWRPHWAARCLSSALTHVRSGR